LNLAVPSTSIAGRANYTAVTAPISYSTLYASTGVGGGLLQ